MATQQKNDSGTVTLLLVDDDVQVRKLCRDCLAESGFRVLESSDGLEALLIAASQTDQGAVIDLLITDIELPRIRGTQLGRAFHELWPLTRVMYISGSGNSASEIDSPDHDVFLGKPFLPASLIQTVEKALAVPCP